MRILFKEEEEIIYENNYSDIEVTAILRSDKIYLPINEEKYYQIKSMAFVDDFEDNHLCFDGKLVRENKEVMFST